MDHSIEQKHSMPGGEGFDLADGAPSEHDGLMEIISQMESRLAALRDSENQRDRLQEEIKNQFDDLDDRERDLRRREAALDGSSSDVRANRAALEAERARIHDSLAEVSKERESLRTREIEVGVMSETLRRDRELLEGRRTQLEAMERELRGREQVLVTQTERIDQEAGELEERKRELAHREAALREREQEAQAMADQQRARADELASQDRELKAAQQRQQAMQAEVISLNRRLADANGMAAEQSRLVEQVRAEGQRSLAEAQKQVEKLETEANRVRVELAKMRRSPLPAAEGSDSVAPRKAGARRPREMSARSRSGVLAMLWLLTVGIAGLGCYMAIALEQPGAGAWLLGLGFAACFVGALGLSSKPLDPSALPVVLFGGLFGGWFPKMLAVVGNALETWDLPLGAVPTEIVPQLPMVLSLLFAGGVVTFLFVFLGASGGLMAQSLFATLAAAGLALLPDPSYSALAAAALLWSGIMGAALARWSMGVPGHEVMDPSLAVGRLARSG